MKGTIAEAFTRAVFELGDLWMTNCELMLRQAGANPKDWVLVTQDLPEGGRNAWVQKSTEPMTPRYPMVQMRLDGMTVTIRLVQDGPSSESRSDAR